MLTVEHSSVGATLVVARTTLVVARTTLVVARTTLVVACLGASHTGFSDAGEDKPRPYDGPRLSSV